MNNSIVGQIFKITLGYAKPQSGLAATLEDVNEVKTDIILCISETDNRLSFYDMNLVSIVSFNKSIHQNEIDILIQNEATMKDVEKYTNNELNKDLFCLMYDKFNTKTEEIKSEKSLLVDIINKNKPIVRNKTNNKQYMITDVEKIDDVLYIELNRNKKIGGKIREYENLFIPKEEFDNNYENLTDNIFGNNDKYVGDKNTEILSDGVSFEQFAKDINNNSQKSSRNIKFGNIIDSMRVSRPTFKDLTDPNNNLERIKDRFKQIKDMKPKTTLSSLNALDILANEIEVADIFAKELTEDDDIVFSQPIQGIQEFEVNVIYDNNVYLEGKFNSEIKKKMSTFAMMYFSESINKEINAHSLFSNRIIRKYCNDTLLDLYAIDIKTIDMIEDDDMDDTINVEGNFIPRYISKNEMTIYRLLFDNADFVGKIEEIMLKFNEKFDIEFSVPDTDKVVMYKGTVPLVIDRVNDKSITFIVNYFNRDKEPYKIRVPKKLIKFDSHFGKFSKSNMFILF